jgi:uncharacterized protein YxeA
MGRMLTRRTQWSSRKWLLLFIYLKLNYMEDIFGEFDFFKDLEKIDQVKEVKKEVPINTGDYIYGFKGFNKDLKCRDFQFQVGKVFKHEGKLKICQKGFHYCRNLNDVTTYYSILPLNRFFIVKAKFHSGIQYNQSNKSVTDELELIEEIPLELLKGYKAYLKEKTKDPDNIFKLEEYRILQTTYPDMILGGSSALYLHGFNIKRDKKSPDIDLILPKYINFQLEDFSKFDHVTEVDNMVDSNSSGNDFDYVAAFVVNGDFIMLDVKIDNKARYEIIEYKGFKYKVCPWNVIIEAKLKYTKNAGTGKKHIQDFKDMFDLKPREEFELVNPLDEIMNKYDR